MSSTINKLPHSQIELSFTLDRDKFEEAREAAFNRIASQIKVPGFRPGKAPKNMLEQYMNPNAPVQQALDEVLNQAFQETLKEHNLSPIAQPEINVESLTTDPIKVTATIQVRPEPEVGEWQKISVAKEAVTVDESKVDDTLKTIFERSTLQDAPNASQEEPALVDAEGNPLTSTTKNATATEMNDAWAQSLGAKDLEALRQQVRQDLEGSASYEVEQKWQDGVMEKLIEMTKVDLPPVFIDDELRRMQSHFEQQLSAMGITLPQYLQQAGKTEADLEEQWKPQAEKQATLEVALAEIAKQDDIQMTEAEVDKELESVDKKTRAQFADPQQRYYLTYSLWRQKVLRHLLEAVEKNGKQV